MECVNLPDCPQVHWFIVDGIKYVNLSFVPATDEPPQPPQRSDSSCR